MAPRNGNKPCPQVTTPQSRKESWTRMLTNIFHMIFYQKEAVKYLSLLSARPMIRGRLIMIGTPLMEVLRTPAELELVLSDTNKLKTRTMICEHRYDNGETALRKHGGRVVTAQCQLPGCDYRMRKMPDGSWVEWPRQAPRSRAASSGSSHQSQPFSAPAAAPSTRSGRAPPWTSRTTLPLEEEEEPWDVMEEDQDSGNSEL